SAYGGAAQRTARSTLSKYVPKGKTTVRCPATKRARATAYALRKRRKAPISRMRRSLLLQAMLGRRARRGSCEVGRSNGDAARILLRPMTRVPSARRFARAARSFLKTAAWTRSDHDRAPPFHPRGGRATSLTSVGIVLLSRKKIFGRSRVVAS